MSSIPEEIYREILLRLPAKSLLLCKSVCRDWYALISNPDFAKLNLNFIIQKDKPKLMLQCCDSNQLYSIDYDSLESPGSIIENVAIEMNQPFKSLDYDVQVYGSCNGLVWLWLFHNGDDGEISCLWNPTTREYKEIVMPPKDFGGINAFGYDNKTGDYKLAMGEESSRSKDSTLLQFYMLSSNSWKPEITIPYVFNEQRFGVLVNGYLHWFVIAQSNLIVCLDFSDESFKEMQLPKELSVKSKDMYMILGVMEGCLCVLYNSYANDVRTHFGVWEMLNYGDQESWTRRYIITQESIFKDHKYLTPLWSFGNGKILFLDSGILVLYDTEHRSARELRMHKHYLEDSVNYFESLVSLKSGTYVGREGRIEESRET